MATPPRNGRGLGPALTAILLVKLSFDSGDVKLWSSRLGELSH